MALNFPYPATQGEIYNAPNGVTYVYDGVKWNVQTAPITGNIAFSNNIISSNNLGNIVIDSNGYFWTFDNTGGLIFPDNSVQTTAGGGNVTISQLINGSHNFSLDSSGSVTAQGNIRIPLTSYIDFANSDTNWRMGYSLNSYTKTTAQSTIDIEVGAGSAGPDGFTVGNSNGQSIFELRGDTRDAWFAHDLTVSNNLTSHLANIVSLNVAQINGTNSGDYLAIQTANFYAWQFGADGTLNLPAANNGNAVIQSPATIELNSNNQIWFFNNNGTLTFPDGSIQPTAFLNNAIINANGENLNPGNPFFIQSSDTVSMGTFAAQSISAGPSGIQLVSTGGVSLQGAAYASVTLGGGTTGDVLVNIGSNQWTFNNSGLTFPDNTVQTTAYTGGGGNPFNQSLNTNDNVEFQQAVAAQFLAAGGVPTFGNTATFGYSFQADTGFDSGMFSVADGHVNIFTNGRSAAEFTDQDIYITTNNSDYSGVNEWQFDTDGMLNLPASIGDIKRDGVSVLGVKYSGVGDASYGDFTVTTEQLVLCNPNGTAQTITLPANPVAGQTVTIKKCAQFNNSGYVITIQGNGYNIDSASSLQINSGYGFVTLVYGFNGRVGTQWWVLDSRL